MALRPMTAAADIVPDGGQASLSSISPREAKRRARLQIVCNNATTEAAWLSASSRAHVRI